MVVGLDQESEKKQIKSLSHVLDLGLLKERAINDLDLVPLQE